MSIYNLSEDADYLVQNILPNKQLFIVDLYKTLILWDPRNSKNLLRHGTIDFLQKWQQTKVIYSDATRDSVVNSLKMFNLEKYFSNIYTDNNVDFERYSLSIPLMHKFYEEIANMEGFDIKEAIVIEDFLLSSQSTLLNHQIDFLMIPVVSDKRSKNYTNLSKKEYFKKKKKVNGFSFKRLLPLEEEIFL